MAAIEKLENVAAACVEAGEFATAAGQMHEALELRCALLGDDHLQSKLAAEAFAGLCISYARHCTDCGAAGQALALLKKAEEVTEPTSMPGFTRRVTLRASTFLHQCCHFRARGKQAAALQAAEKAMALKQRYPEAVTNGPLLELNYASLLSAAGRHRDAMAHIEAAMSEIAAAESESLMDRNWSPEDAEEAHAPERVMLVVAHFNRAAELGLLGDALGEGDGIRRAARLARYRLGGDHPMTARVERAMELVHERGAQQRSQLSVPFLASVTPSMRSVAASELSASARVPDGPNGAWLMQQQPQVTFRMKPSLARAAPDLTKRPNKLSARLTPLQAKERIFGQLAKPPAPSMDLSGGIRQQRRAAGETKVGSAVFQQQMHGAEPMTVPWRPDEQPLEGAEDAEDEEEEEKEGAPTEEQPAPAAEKAQEPVAPQQAEEGGAGADGEGGQEFAPPPRPLEGEGGSPPPQAAARSEAVPAEWWDFPTAHAAATRIQARARGNSTRQWTNVVLCKDAAEPSPKPALDDKGAALEIQRVFRGRRARKQMAGGAP